MVFVGNLTAGELVKKNLHLFESPIRHFGAPEREENRSGKPQKKMTCSISKNFPQHSEDRRKFWISYLNNKSRDELLSFLRMWDSHNAYCSLNPWNNEQVDSDVCTCSMVSSDDLIAEALCVVQPWAHEPRQLKKAT